MQRHAETYRFWVIDVGENGQRVVQPHHVWVRPEQGVSLIEDVQQNVGPNKNLRFECVVSKTSGLDRMMSFLNQSPSEKGLRDFKEWMW